MDYAAVQQKISAAMADPACLLRLLALSFAANAVLVLVCIGLGSESGAASWAALFGVPAAFLLAFANAANDAANSMGTVVGANAMTMRSALLLDAAVEALGAMLIGPFVAGTIAAGELHTEVFARDPNLFALAMLAVTVSGGATTLLATLYGAPISATHGVVSGIVAVGLVCGTHGAVDWDGFGWTVVGWVASPVAGLLAGLAVSLAVHVLVLGAPDPSAAARARQHWLLGATALISYLLVLLKGPPKLAAAVTGGSVWAAAAVALALAAATALVHRSLAAEGGGPLPGLPRWCPVWARRESGGAAAWLASRRRRVWGRLEGDEPEDAEAVRGPAGGAVAAAVAAAAATAASAAAAATTRSPVLAAAEVEMSARDGGPASDQRPLSTSSAPPSPPSSPPASPPPSPPSQPPASSGKHFDERFDERFDAVQRPFVPLLIGAGLTVAFAHGGNDVGNAVGPLAVMVFVARHGAIPDAGDAGGQGPTVPFAALALGTLGFVCGIVGLGARTITTVGSQITELTPSRSFATQVMPHRPVL